MSQDTDLKHMQRAFELAEAQAGRTGKNPAVGCVIVSTAGRVLSEAATGDGGHLHAEQIALEQLTAKPDGATAYVTLEPCRERTGGEAACSTRLVEAGIVRLVCAIADTHPQGAGGLERLRETGIDVETGLMADEAAKLYAGFFAGPQSL